MLKEKITKYCAWEFSEWIATMSVEDFDMKYNH